MDIMHHATAIKHASAWKDILCSLTVFGFLTVSDGLAFFLCIIPGWHLSRSTDVAPKENHSCFVHY